MSDDAKCKATTPAATLEQHITDSRVPKSEAEWWAYHEITRLREENARLREALEPFAPDSQWIDPAIPDGRPIDAMFLAGELRAAAAAIRGKVKAEAACPEPDEAP